MNDQLSDIVIAIDRMTAAQSRPPSFIEPELYFIESGA
jgi:hypothetical protein